MNNPPLCCDCFTAHHGDEPDMDPDFTWEPGTCATCAREGTTFRYADLVPL